MAIWVYKVDLYLIQGPKRPKTGAFKTDNSSIIRDKGSYSVVARIGITLGLLNTSNGTSAEQPR